MARTKKTTTTTATAPAPAVVRHRPAITRGADDCGRLSYRLVCTCGQAGPEHAARRMAQVDLDQHLGALPVVPAGQRCADPARHDRRPWEACAVCADQLPLFDL